MTGQGTPPTDLLQKLSEYYNSGDITAEGMKANIEEIMAIVIKTTNQRDQARKQVSELRLELVRVEDEREEARRERNKAYSEREEAKRDLRKKQKELDEVRHELRQLKTRKTKERRR